MISTDYFDRITKRLLISDPFYGLLIMSLKKNFTDKDEICPTAGVAAEGINYILWVNTEFFNKLSEAEAKAVLKHEACHIFFEHVTDGWRKSLPNHKLANYAMDMEINQNITDLPEGCVNYEKDKVKYPDLKPLEGSKYYYKYYNALPPDQQPNGGGQEGLGNSAGSHMHWKDIEDLPEAQKELIKSQADTILKKAAEQVMKCRGTIPSIFQGKVDELFAVKEEVFNWKAYFRRLLGNAEEYFLKSTRKKPSKRFEGASGIKHKHKHNILVAIDESGSVSDHDLCDFFSEIHHMYKSGTKVDILEFDTQIQKRWTYAGKWDLQRHACGGTDFSEPIEEFNKKSGYYTALVMLTDGYAPIDVQPRGRMIWVLTADHSNQTYPGVTVTIPAESKKNK